MRFLIGIIGAILVFVAVNFLPPVQNYYDAKASAYLELDDLKKARRFYLPGKIRGTEKSVNNYHVLNHRIIRNSENPSDKQLHKSRKKAFRAFDKLTQRGYVPAAYNAGMLYYRSPINSDQYKAGLQYFDFAAAQGDKLSRDAAGLMRARAHDKDERSKRYRNAADDGNGLAAYHYVKGLRFDKKKLRRAEKYAVMGAEAGYADAQEFLTTYFPKRGDRKEWLEKAATNPENRSLIAAYDLAMVSGKRRDYKGKRKWLTLGATPREKFKYRILFKPEGLRWRGLQNSIMADANNSKKAAYELALMQIEGIGGPIDKAGAIENLTYAEDWTDAPALLARLKSGKIVSGQKPKFGGKTDLERFDLKKHWPYYEKLRPYVKSKQIRYATDADIKKYAQGVATTYNDKKDSFKTKGGIEKCRLNSNCFYMAKPIILPKGMNGAHSATFLINPASILPRQSRSHNRYIFLNERYIP